MEVPYQYSALRIDTSLRQMLERWARDTALGFQMKCVNDYTIPYKLLTIKSPNLKTALDEVNEIYTQQGIKAFLDESRQNLIFSCDKISSRTRN